MHCLVLFPFFLKYLTNAEYLVGSWPVVLKSTLMIPNNTGQQRFCPTRQNVCLWCIFGCRIQICFQNFSITHTFHSRLKGSNVLSQDTKVCFYRGCHEEFKDIFSQGDAVFFCNDVCSIVEVLGHEYNPDLWHLFIDSSKVSLKVFLLHKGNRFPSVPLHHAANMEEIFIKAWSYCWERLSMTNLSGSYVVLSRLWHCYLECNWVTKNTAVSCASGTAGTRRLTM